MPPPFEPRPGTVPLPSAIQRYFEVALYLLVLTGFGTLASTGSLDLATVVFVGAALLLRGYLLAKRRTVLISDRWTNVLTLSYVAIYLADYFVISRSFMIATVHLVLFVMVVRLFSTHRDRNFYFLAVISFLMVLAAAVLTVDSTFLLSFAAFMLMAVVTFILMEMRRAAGKATVHAMPANDPLTSRRMAFSLAGASPALVFLILLGAGGIFFILPRISGGYLNAYAPTGEFATGFSDRVQLGQIGQIQQSTALVMHIQINGDPHGAFDLKWRGVALSVFDGKNWMNPHEPHIAPRLPDGRFSLSLDAQTNPEPAPHRTIHYRVLMEPMANNVFFLAPLAETIEGNYRTVGIDGSAVFDLDPEHPVSRYEASSNIAEPAPADLRAASDSYPPGILLTYLQLPNLDPRTLRLAYQVTASASNNYDRAVAIENYLRANFGYTLQLPRTVPHDPIANFLFERKQGHCEYFASAMAVMLRALRIPSRIVNGFRTGEFNDVTAQYLIRASNAHAWVEAYFPGYGWISFDPTPAAPAQMRTGWSRALLYVDALASFWREWVINYDVRHQYTLGQEVLNDSLRWLGRLRSWSRRQYDALLDRARRTEQSMSEFPSRWSIAGVALTLLLVLSASVGRLWRLLCRYRVAARPEKSPRTAATIWYERMARTLAKRGWHRSPTQTPAEFVTSVQDETLREPVRRFTQHYERARFGDSPDDASRLPGLYEEISAASRK